MAFPDADRLVRLSQVQQDSPETNVAPVRLEWNSQVPLRGFAGPTPLIIGEEAEPTWP